MTGREERDQKIEKRIKSKLSEMPKYMTEYYYSLSSKTASTKENYIGKVRLFLIYLYQIFDINYWTVEALKNTKPYMISQYLTEKIDGEGAAKATVFYSIRNFYSFLESNGIIAQNPADKVDPPRDKKMHEITYLTEDEIKLVADTITTDCLMNKSYYRNMQERRDLAWFYTLVFTGMRVSSLAGLNDDDVDFESGRIRIVEKGDKTRYIKMSKTLSDILMDYVNSRWFKRYHIDTDAFFVTRLGTRISVNEIYTLLKGYTRDLDKKISPHKLRATYATTAIKKTKNIYLVANQLGHANVKTTSRYAAVDESMQEEAASVMDDLFD